MSIVNKNNINPGTLVISLDFELYWGMRDLVSLADYEQQLSGVRQAVPAILDLFKQYNISATWAIVGFLYYQNAEELKSNFPSQLPSYHNRELSPYSYVATLNPESDRNLHFCEELIDLIKQYPRQEIGTHTFSHYYCLEPGQTAAEFKVDLEAAIATANRKNIDIKSLVFPRNQYNQAYLEVLKEVGITSYRGNETSQIYNSIDGDGGKLSKRLLRLLDSYLDLSGHNCYSLTQLKAGYPVNIPSSRFLRPYSDKLKHFDSLRLRRITSGIAYAAQHGLVYHLWWHPHNFGTNLDQNLHFLEKILRFYQELEQQNKMRSLTMEQLADICHKV
ncbi:MAG: polysaccharide deacetylase family protein [Pleurocapsa sp.]